MNVTWNNSSYSMFFNYFILFVSKLFTGGNVNGGNINGENVNVGNVDWGKQYLLVETVGENEVKR